MQHGNSPLIAEHLNSTDIKCITIYTSAAISVCAIILAYRGDRKTLLKFCSFQMYKQDIYR